AHGCKAYPSGALFGTLRSRPRPIDTLRPDYLDAYGYPRSTAPFLTEMLPPRSFAASQSVTARRP
ncbi:MAG: hypothetical protein ACRD3V_06280, partial [Vicinamibacteria bacterium]